MSVFVLPQLSFGYHNPSDMQTALEYCLKPGDIFLHGTMMQNSTHYFDDTLSCFIFDNRMIKGSNDDSAEKRVYENLPHFLKSPLKQLKSGISVDEIKCNGNLILIQKHNGSPACVTESTKQKLIERGWIDIDISESKNNSENDTLRTQIAVDPSNNFYFSGDEIVIRGSVWDSEMTNLQKIPVVLQISFDDELIDVVEVPLSTDGIFSHHIMASGSLWNQSGIYTITASYDSETVAQNKFGFSAYYQNSYERYFVNYDTDDYEELCGSCNS